MTAPHLRTRALLKTMRFLDELTRPSDTPRVPSQIRETARRLLLHYPNFEAIEAAHESLPEVFGPVVQRQAEGLPTMAEASTLLSKYDDDLTGVPRRKRGTK